MKQIAIKRVYEEAFKQDGYRLLVDKVWPRGVKKEEAKLDEWNKNIAPSTDLRKWFDHKPERFEEFEKRYIKELDRMQDEIKHIKEVAKVHKVTLLYGAKDEQHNQAVVLKDYLSK